VKRFLTFLTTSSGLKFGVLLLVVAAAHYPSLFQAARADQWVYLFTTKDKNDLYSLTIGTYSWNREIGGDIHFFRPVLFFLLGLERWAFSPGDFFAWQLVNLVLHLAVVLQLFCLLRTWYGPQSVLALVAAAFFGVQYTSMELVAWHHLSGYLLFCVLLISVCLLLARPREKCSRFSQSVLVLLLFLAAFTLELGNILAVLVALFMLCVNFARQRSSAPSAGECEVPAPTGRFHGLAILGALAVPVVYTAANVADQYYRYGQTLAGPTHEGRLPLLTGLAGMAWASRLWFETGLLPSKIDLGVDSRMSIVTIRDALTPALALQLSIALTALGAFLVVLGGALRRKPDVRRMLLGAAALLFALSYCAVLVFLRAGPRGLYGALQSNSYYAYIFNLSTLVFLSSLVDLRVPALAMRKWSGRLPRVVLGIALAATAVLSGWRVYAQGRAEAQWCKPTLMLVEQIRRLQKANGDNDFTFCVAPDDPGERELPYVGQSKSGGGRALTASEILFPGSYTHVNPKYYLWGRYHGFDLVTFNGRVVGIPVHAWPANLARFSPREGARCLTGATAQEVEQGIDRLRGGLAVRPAPAQTDLDRK
jgi:hypothetical protein